jgi:hypothetical protein
MEDHWRNQSDFLHYELYDDYFSLERFSEAIKSLNSKGFKVHDTRQALMHDISRFQKVDGDFSKSKGTQLKEMKKNGKLPSYKSMFSESEIKQVNDIYYDDLKLYKSLFGDRDLLFK